MVAAFALDAVWLVGMWALFMRQFQAARVRGALLNIGE
jgi:ABC-2 type transport system permease protein